MNNRGVSELGVSLYLDLMARVLTDSIYEVDGTNSLNGMPYSPEIREDGQDWPTRAHTMIGLKRLENVRRCTEATLEQGIPGDFMETGVWRGGAAILMRAVLSAYGDRNRRVWVADSFCGLPPPDPARFPVDEGDKLHEQIPLAVSLDQVRANFQRYGLLDDSVVFVEGWFRDTLPACAVERLAVLRLDGDMYESTYIALESLYPKLSVGGYLIVDDYGAMPSCKKAVMDYRERHGIREPMEEIDWTGVCWQRNPSVG